MSTGRGCQPASAAHGTAVIFIRRSTMQANLIVLPMNPGVRPGEAMRTEHLKKPCYEWCCHNDFSLALDKCVESATMAEIEPVQIPVLVTLL